MEGNSYLVGLDEAKSGVHVETWWIWKTNSETCPWNQKHLTDFTCPTDQTFWFAKGNAANEPCADAGSHGSRFSGGCWVYGDEVSIVGNINKLEHQIWENQLVISSGFSSWSWDSVVSSVIPWHTQKLWFEIQDIPFLWPIHWYPLHYPFMADNLGMVFGIGFTTLPWLSHNWWPTKNPRSRIPWLVIVWSQWWIIDPNKVGRLGWFPKMPEFVGPSAPDAYDIRGFTEMCKHVETQIIINK